MTLLPQIIQLLTESPGNIVYHLVTLFALQAVLGIAFSQWRRNKQDKTAVRTAIAAGFLIAGRLIIMVASLIIINNDVSSIVILPPLEQMVNTVTAVFLLWAFIPSPQKLPRLGHILLLLTLLVVGIMGLSFAQAWAAQVADAPVPTQHPYNGTPQATVWGVVQIVLLAAGLVVTLLNGRLRPTFRPFILGLLLLAHLAHFWNYPELIPSGTDIPYWIRLGYLAALPLWAIMTYRESLAPLVALQLNTLPAHQQLNRSLALAADVIESDNRRSRLQTAAEMTARLTDAAFVGIGLQPDEAPETVRLISNLPQPQTNAPRTWQLHLSDWEPMAELMRSGKRRHLPLTGSKARQVYALYEALGIGALGGLLLEPLKAEDEVIGLMILALPDGRIQWPISQQKMLPGLAKFVAQAALRSQSQPVAPPPPEETTAPDPPLPSETDPNLSGRLIALEEERERLVQNLEIANNRLLQAETRAATATRRSQDLAAALEEMETLSRDEKINALEEEIATLRESLIEAEEAMALAAAGEGGLSTEWVMLTITRYSGQLEEAQARIAQLESELAKRERGPSDDMLISLVQELRTPMTSIGGFTDLLLGETLGILGVKQRDFLQRIQSNTERMGSLLEQILQLTAVQEPQATPEDEMVNVREMLETAVNGMVSHLRDKNLQLDLDIAQDLPALPVSRSALHQIFSNLLSNACLASSKNGRVVATAYAQAIPDSKHNANDTIRFLQVNISDSGSGIRQEDLPYVFDPNYDAKRPLIAGLGDTGAGLSMAYELTNKHGGRLWVESEPGSGSTFSLLFPIASDLIITTSAPSNGSQSHP
ncbi:sensor histidine kinase [Candidatus Leptofilum sp.]|uniref:sensor histidine kinase n=1 Tax=Candidatus Leptofilum sp. TaxID=3241576 RepID=UPI003B5A1C2C